MVTSLLPLGTAIALLERGSNDGLSKDNAAAAGDYNWCPVELRKEKATACCANSCEHDLIFYQTAYRELLVRRNTLSSLSPI